MPWWWFLPYLTVMVVFTGIIVVMILLGVTPAVAVGVPAALSIAAVSALTRVAKINPANRSVPKPADQRSKTLTATPTGDAQQQREQ